MAKKLWLLPLVLAIFLPITCLISYTIAVLMKHVSPGFPYISDTGSLAPERCFFGQLMNIYAALSCVFMYVRYSQIREHYRIIEELGGHTPVRKRKLIANKVALVVGLLGALGTSMVGNFQEDGLIEMHIAGAFMAFGLGGIYAWIHSILSYSIPSLNGTSKYCHHLRLTVVASYTLMFAIMMIFTYLSMQLFDGNIKNWGPENPGYDEHLVATITEWLLVVLLSVFFGTFVPEFRNIGFKCHVVQFHHTRNDEDLI